MIKNNNIVYYATFYWKAEFKNGKVMYLENTIEVKEWMDDRKYLSLRKMMIDIIEKASHEEVESCNLVSKEEYDKEDKEEITLEVECDENG